MRCKVNYWISESIKLANSAGYLDKLAEVYPVKISEERLLSPQIRTELREMIKKADDATLIVKLLNKKEFPIFPIKDPYVAFLRKNEKFIYYNPKTIKRLADNIRRMDFDKIIEALEKPKEFNRQIGPLFQKWLFNLGFPVLNEKDFNEADEIAFLKGSDSALKKYANKKLAVKLPKGLDFIAKKKDKFIIAEVKFLTDTGGHQTTQFENALQILESTERPNLIRVAVLDGIVWIESNNKMHQTIRQVEEIAISSLLLKELLENIT